MENVVHAEPTRLQMASASIVIVEDDKDIRLLVSRLMCEAGFLVEVAADARGLDSVLLRTRPDLLILDLMLPGEDGLSICRRLRARENFPILMLTARSDETDRVVGLELGADDYLVKPFGPRELVARVRVMLRRGHVLPAATAPRRVEFAGLVMDPEARRVSGLSDAGVVEVPLTAAEFDLLACFVVRPRRVLTREQLFQWLRGRIPGPLDRAVDMIVSRLRRKLAGAGASTSLIATVRNGGYLFTAAVRRIV